MDKQKQPATSTRSSTDCYVADASKWIVATGDDLADALKQAPKINEPLSEGSVLKVAEIKAVPLPRTFFDWLFNRPRRWWVTANYSTT